MRASLLRHTYSCSSRCPSTSPAKDTVRGLLFGRCAHLCYTFLKPEFPAATVRSILAYRGHIPESQKTGIVKTLPIPEVPEYITWFKENTLDDALMKEIVETILDISE